MIDDGDGSDIFYDEFDNADEMHDRKPLFVQKPKQEDISFVIKQMANANSFFYFPVITTGITSKPSIYMEDDPENRYFGIGRIFVSEADVNKYLSWLSGISSYDPSSFKGYQATLTKAISHANDLSAKQKLPVKFVVTTFYNNIMVDVMIFWDGIPN